MEVWIETADVVDINEHVFRGAGSGIPATGYPRGLSKGIPSEFRGKPAGWCENPGGKGRYVRGADLPRLVYVRWQSMAEPQTYEAYIEIPESARDTMLKGEKRLLRRSTVNGKRITEKLLTSRLGAWRNRQSMVRRPLFKSDRGHPRPRHDQSQRSLRGHVQRKASPAFRRVQSLHRQIRHPLWLLVTHEQSPETSTGGTFNP